MRGETASAGIVGLFCHVVGLFCPLSEFAGHVITQAQLEKESSLGKTLNTSCTALSQEIAWMSNKLTGLF